MIDLTIAIPTYNGEQRLPQLLRHLQAQTEVETVSWEVLVVDNNSSDATAAVVQSFQADFPCPLRDCFEPKQGIGPARQRAIQESHSELIGFLDDDNWPAANWVAMAHAFGQQHPRAGAYGSRITAAYEVEPPPGFQRIQLFCAIVERGDHPRLYEPAKRLLPPGAGLIVRRQAWLGSILETSQLNRLGIKRSDGNDCSEDVEALAHIQKAGWQIWYAPSLQVVHCIPSWRFKPDYLRPLFRSIGLSRTVTRLVRMQPWQRPFLLIAYLLSDSRNLLQHLLKYRGRLKTDLVAACELELYLGIWLSPFYLLFKTLTHSQHS